LAQVRPVQRCRVSVKPKGRCAQVRREVEMCPPAAGAGSKRRPGRLNVLCGVEAPAPKAHSLGGIKWQRQSSSVYGVGGAKAATRKGRQRDGEVVIWKRKVRRVEGGMKLHKMQENATPPLGPTGGREQARCSVLPSVKRVRRS